MTDLKTLKEIVRRPDIDDIVSNDDYETTYGELRSEAIKWVNFLNEAAKKNRLFCVTHLRIWDSRVGCDMACDVSSASVFRKFFNISDEDLKDKESILVRTVFESIPKDENKELVFNTVIKTEEVSESDLKEETK